MIFSFTFSFAFLLFIRSPVIVFCHWGVDRGQEPTRNGLDQPVCDARRELSLFAN
jgi:hypothetical protein